ncbi:MAG TPA: serine protease [Longimicrobium sp.]
MNPTRVLLSASLVVLLSGCSILGPWPYRDDSDPRIGPESGRQLPVTSISAPLANVCHLTTTRINIKGLWFWGIVSNGSAALIDGRYLITAAHNVADYAGGNRLTKMEVRCGATAADGVPADVVLTRSEIRERAAVPSYAWRLHSNDKKYEFDYAFVDLGRQLNIENQFVLDESILPDSGDAVFIAGYPGGTISNAHTLHQGRGRATERDHNLLSYEIGTATGNSGGPVWMIHDEKPHLVAVHVSDRAGRVLNSTFYRDWAAWRSARDNGARR